MTDRSNHHSVLIKFSASSGAERLVETGIRMATIHGLEVTGTFRQQKAILDLPDFPFATAHLPGVHRAERMTKSSMMQAIRRQSTYCRKLLSERATRSKLKWTYLEPAFTDEKEPAQFGIQVLQKDRILPDSGELLQSIKTAANASSIVAISAGHSILAVTGPVLAVVDPSEEHEPIIRQAARLASAEKERLVVLVLQSQNKKNENLEPDIRSIVGPLLNLTIIHAGNESPEEVSLTANQMNAAFVVADLSDGMFVDETLAPSLLRSINSPIILIAQN